MLYNWLHSRTAHTYSCPLLKAWTAFCILLAGVCVCRSVCVCTRTHEYTLHAQVPSSVLVQYAYTHADRYKLTVCLNASIWIRSFLCALASASRQSHCRASEQTCLKMLIPSCGSMHGRDLWTQIILESASAVRVMRCGLHDGAKSQLREANSGKAVGVQMIATLWEIREHG